MSKPIYTGLRCPACREPVAIIENQLPRTLVFFCPGMRAPVVG